MNLQEKRLWSIFLICLVFTLFTPAFLPQLRLMYFAPFLVITYYQKPAISCLWWSFGCGIILDLLSPHTHFGLYALTFCITTVLLYRQKLYFFADRLTTLPLMTFCFSSLSTLIHAFIFNVFEERIFLSWIWAKSDLLIIPFFDAFFAFAIFILPFFLFGKRPRRGKDYFL